MGGLREPRKLRADSGRSGIGRQSYRHALRAMNALPARDRTTPTPSSRRSGRRVVEVEIRGAGRPSQRAHRRRPSPRPAELLLACRGRVVCTGMGKSGHIARKIAATLASTGTPAFFVHPGEASHGDLGMITDADVVLALSNSGETDEMLMHRCRCSSARATADRDDRPARLDAGARIADVHLDVSVPAEACPLGLAPTAEHHRRAGARRCARGGAARGARLHRRRLRALASGRRARPPPAAAHHRRHARRRRRAARARRRHAQRSAGRDEPQAPGHDRGGRRRRTACSACSPTATCAARSTTPRSTCAPRRIDARDDAHAQDHRRATRSRSRPRS